MKLTKSRKKISFIAGGAAFFLLIILIFAGRNYKSAAAGLNGLTGTGKSSNVLTAANFPEITSLQSMGEADIVKRRTPINKPTVEGNKITLTTAPTYKNSELIESSGYNYARVGATAMMPMDINMKQSWILKCRIRLPKLDGKGTGSYGGIYLVDDINTYPAGFGIIGQTTVAGSKANFFGYSTIDPNKYSSGTIFQSKGTNAGVDFDSDFGSYKDMVLQYNAVDGSMKCDFGDKTASVSSSSSRFKKNKNKTRLMFFGFHCYSSDNKKVSTSNQGVFEFQSFKYTDYSREITNTQLLDYAGRPISGPVGSGHEITVKHTIKGVKDNKFLNIGLNGTSNVSYPVTGQQIKVNDSVVSNNNNLLSSGLSFTPVNVNNVSYKLKVETTKEYTPGDTFQFTGRLVDDFLAGARSQPTNWPSSSRANFDAVIKNDLHRKLIRKDKAPEGSSYDYYLDSSQNKYGWNKTDVVIRMVSGKDFNELNVNNTAYTGNVYTVSGNTNASGNVIKLFGRKGTSTQTQGLSAVTIETIKIDKIKPTLTLNSRVGRTLKANDGNSGIQKIEWKKSGGEWETLKDYTNDASGATHGALEVTDAQYKLEEIGAYEFRAVDYADNASNILTIKNSKPSISASSAEATWYQTSANYSIVNALNTRVSDPEETMSLTNVKWSIKRADDSAYPDSFTERTGTGTGTLSSALPLGKYTVTLTCKDSDENETSVNVTLTVKTDGAPSVISLSDSNALPITGPAVYKPNGTAHTVSRDEYMLIADPEEPYSGGKLDKAEAVQEVKRLYSFVTSYQGGTLNSDVRITKNGVDFTDIGINTAAEGEYVIFYQATDNEGNSVTLELTYMVREDYYISFDPGKGEFKEPEAEYKAQVKIGENVSDEDVPPEEEIQEPVERTFIGWSTDKKAGVNSVVDPTAVEVAGDTTFYAVYAADINRDSIDDRLQAIFEFKTSDEENSAYPQSALTLIGITPEDGEKASLKESDIPEVLKMPGYYLKGWLIGDSTAPISTENLLKLEKEAGTYTKVTAVFDVRTVVEETEANVTFFSSDPENAPLIGGEGQKVALTTKNSTKPVQLGEKIPGFEAKPGYVLTGWKTDETQDTLLTPEELAEMNIYGGNQLTCIAYFKYDPTLLDMPVVFQFFSNDEENAPLKEGNGCKVNLTSVKGSQVSISEEKIPKVKLEPDTDFKGWRTNITGDRLLSSEELCELKASANDTVTCIAYSSHDINTDKEIVETPLVYEKIIKEIDERTELGEKIVEYIKSTLGEKEKVIHSNTSSTKKQGSVKDHTDNEKSGRSDLRITTKETGNVNETGILSSLEDEKVPLGAVPSNSNWNNNAGILDQIRGCFVHYAMIIWLLLLIISFLKRLSQRKHAEFPIMTDKRDYLSIITGGAVGVILYLLGNCILEIFLSAAGAAVILVYLVRMKALDHKDKKELEQIRDKVENQILNE